MKIVLCGACGRMGEAIRKRLDSENDLTLSTALEQAGHPAVGQSLVSGEARGQKPVSVSDDIKKGLMQGDVVVDFSTPAGTLAVLREAALQKIPMVIGTTGFTPEEEKEIARGALEIPIVFASNMSVGVNVVFHALAEMTRRLGEAYDVEIVEMHHRHKKDAPSGTALQMGKVIASARNTTLAKAGRFSREGVIGARPPFEIGIQSLRGGDVVGEHTVIFAGPGERIEITHRAESRDNFARGALLAARWVVRQPPGLYDMADVLELK